MLLQLPEQPLPHAVFTVGAMLTRERIRTAEPDLKTFCVILKQMHVLLIDLFLEHYSTPGHLLNHLYF